MHEAQNRVLEVARVAEMPALHDKGWMESEDESRSGSEGASAKRVVRRGMIAAISMVLVSLVGAAAIVCAHGPV
jgi:hypothetical protein